jgi:hypothetical protein
VDDLVELPDGGVLAATFTYDRDETPAYRSPLVRHAHAPGRGLRVAVRRARRHAHRRDAERGVRGARRRRAEDLHLALVAGVAAVAAPGMLRG